MGQKSARHALAGWVLIIAVLLLYVSSSALNQSRTRDGPHTHQPGAAWVAEMDEFSVGYGRKAVVPEEEQTTCMQAGWQDHKDHDLHKQIIEQIKPKRVLEVGCMVGSSLLELGPLISESWQHVVSDVSIQTYIPEETVHINEAKLDAKVHVLQGTLQELYDKGDIPGDQPFDLIFLDHSRDDQDALGWLMKKKLIGPGAYVLTSSVDGEAGLMTGSFVSWLKKAHRFRRQYHDEYIHTEVYVKT